MGKRNLGIYTIYNNELYVKTQQCGISMLIVLMGEVPMCHFGKDMTMWTKATDVIAWFENEIIEGIAYGYSAEQIDYYQQCVLAYEDRIRQHITEGKENFEPCITWKGKRGY